MFMYLIKFNSFSLCAAMKRRLDISSSSASLPELVPSSPPPPKRKLVDETACDNNKEVSDEKQEEQQRQYFDRNRFMKYHWPSAFPDLPGQLLVLLEAAKHDVIESRDSKITGGQSPFYQICQGLEPVKDWDDNLFNFLMQNEKCRLLTPDRAKFAHTSTALDTRLKLRSEEWATPTEDQARLIEKIHQLHASTVINFNLIALRGAAGTGKTYVLSQFKGMNVEYITTTKLLCNDVKEKYNIKTTTLCKLLMTIFNIEFHQTVKLQELLKHTSHSIFLDCPNVFDIVQTPMQRWKYFMRTLKLLPVFCSRQIQRRLIFLDEFSMIPASTVALIISYFKNQAIRTNLNTVLIVSGDANQIPPLFISPSHTFNYLEDIAAYSFTFTKQMRSLDPEYTTILENLLTTNTLQNYLYDTFKHVDESEIEYNYPINRLRDGPQKREDILQWMTDKDIFNVVNLIFFSFTNRELHFHNTSIAVSVWRQLIHHNDIEPSNFVQFQMLKSRMREPAFKYQFCNKDQTVKQLPHVLPLVRYFPYKLLTREIPSLARSTILILMHWTQDKVYMLNPKNNILHTFGPTRFNMNLYRGVQFWGFPIQMHIGETSFSSQGLTLTRDICINSSNFTRNELYVTLSRIRSKNKCIRFHTP